MNKKRVRSSKKDSLTEANTSIPPELFRSEIAKKLQAILDGLSSSDTNEIPTENFKKIKPISKQEKPATYFSKDYPVTRSQKVNCENQLLTYFVDKIKSRICELLSKENNNLEPAKTLKENASKNQISPTFSTTHITDSLQIQITQKLQSILCPSAVGRDISNDCNFKQGYDTNTDDKWKSLADTLQDFVDSARKKLSTALSKDVQQENLVKGFHSKSSFKENKSNCSEIKKLRAFRQSSQRVKFSESPCLNALGASYNMISPIHSEGDSFDSPCIGTSGARSSRNYYGGGLLLLEDAERAPEYLRLTIDSDVDDEPEPTKASDSEEDVMVVGVKRPTYQEITLEEDEEGKVQEKVIEKEKGSSTSTVQETNELFQCSSCNKSFRAESLLKFHVKMHNTMMPDSNKETSDSSLLQSGDLSESGHKSKKRKKKRHSSEIREERKLSSSKLPLKHKLHKDKHKSHKKHKHKKSKHS